MIDVLIVDDEQHCINAVGDQLSVYKQYTICGTAKTVEEAVAITKEKQPKLVFLDIILGDKTGFDYLNIFMPRLSFDVIFTTAYNEYAVKAFEFTALHYLLKPIDAKHFLTALSRLEEKISQTEYLERMLSLEYNLKRNHSDKFIHLRTTDIIKKVNTDEILFLKADSNYTVFHLDSGEKKTSSKTLKHYAQNLKDLPFYKVSKSYLVNTNKINFYKKKTRQLYMMTEDEPITVAVRRHKDFTRDVMRD